MQQSQQDTIAVQRIPAIASQGKHSLSYSRSIPVGILTYGGSLTAVTVIVDKVSGNFTQDVKVKMPVAKPI